MNIGDQVFEKFLLTLRQETKDIIAIANTNGGDYPDMKAIPNDELRTAVDEYHRRNKKALKQQLGVNCKAVPNRKRWAIVAI